MNNTSRPEEKFPYFRRMILLSSERENMVTENAINRPYVDLYNSKFHCPVDGSINAIFTANEAECLP